MFWAGRSSGPPFSWKRSSAERRDFCFQHCEFLLISYSGSVAQFFVEAGDFRNRIRHVRPFARGTAGEGVRALVRRAHQTRARELATEAQVQRQRRVGGFFRAPWKKRINQ